MKATAKPEFSKKWWTSEKPADIKGTDLEKALASVEKALAEEKKSKADAAALATALSALVELESAVDKTIKKECDKKKHKDVITVLEKFPGLINEESSRIEKLKQQAANAGGEEEDEEETDDKLFQSDYLYKMLKILKSTGKELNFGFGLDTKNPESSKLVLARKGKPERLFKALKASGDFSNRLITYGKAVPDAQDGKVLVFKLAESAGEPPQVLKLGRRFLRADKALKFRKLKLIMPGGQTFADTDPDPEDGPVAAGTAGPSTADMAPRLKSATIAAETWKRAQDSVADQIEQLRRELDAFDDADAASVRDRLDTVLDRFPALDFSPLTQSTDRAAFDRALAKTRTGLGKWGQLLGSNSALNVIDENPFVKLNVADTFGDALVSIARELRM